MKGINTLIRLSKRALDELRKKQVMLENQKARLQQGIANLNKELQGEMKLAAKSPEMGSFYGGFAKRIKEKQNELQEEIKKVDVELTALSESIMQAFTDLKKYEIARDNDLARKKADAARKETIMMDEVASTQFIRKQKESSE